jgi:hypothetical protein
VAVNAEVIITVSWLPELTMHAVSAACPESSLSMAAKPLQCSTT